jgi:serine/threonine protein phosphatase PrpC/tRNA A-37 threonylcarbamoyl transferase component Bud32
MSFEIDLGHVSIVGRRQLNEDFVGALYAEPHEWVERGVIAALADGVSQGGGGLEAAQTSVMTLLDGYFSTKKTWDTTVALDRILAAQNSWLHGLNQKDANKQRATTLTAIVLRGQTYTLAHIGDSRALIVRDGSVERISQDHTRHGDTQSVLTRALGVDERALIDYQQGNLQLNDCLLLMSDGAWGSLTDKDLLAAIQTHPVAQTLADALVEKAFAKGSTDNISVVVALIKGLPTADLRAGTLRSKNLSTPKKLRVGESLDQFTITQVVANNGVNLVYQARDSKSGELFAIKTLCPERASDEAEKATLAHEQWLAEQLDDPAFIRCHPQPNATTHYVVYDWHSGATLEKLIEPAAPELTLEQCLTLARQVLQAISKLHRRGIVHRDIKPANLHRDEKGQWRIFDLGVAMSGEEPESTRELHAGTPAFINPEQWQGQKANQQSDLFSTGVTLYKAMTKRLPYGEIEPYQIARYNRDATPPTRFRADMPIWFEAILLKSVARNSKDRFETAEEFLLALERGAARPLSAPRSTPLLSRDQTLGIKIALAVSLFLNFLLIALILITS